jgi:hypothetical protein
MRVLYLSPLSQAEDASIHYAAEKIQILYFRIKKNP